MGILPSLIEKICSISIISIGQPNPLEVFLIHHVLLCCMCLDMVFIYWTQIKEQLILPKVRVLLHSILQNAEIRPKNK